MSDLTKSAFGRFSGTYQQLKEATAALEAAIATACDRLAKYPKGPMGLTPDEAKDPAWYADMKAVATFRARRQQLWRGMNTKFAKEMRSEARERRAAKGWV